MSLFNIFRIAPCAQIKFQRNQKNITKAFFTMSIGGTGALLSALSFYLCCTHVSDFAHCFHDMLLNADKKVHEARPECLV